MITVFISYNPVRGFVSGWHANGTVFICANDADAVVQAASDARVATAGSVMHSISNQFYKGSVPVDQVTKYIVYAGLHAFQSAINMAKTLQQRAPDATVIVAGCRCDWPEKQRLLQGTQITLIRCECGGRVKMGELATEACST